MHGQNNTKVNSKLPVRHAYHCDMELPGLQVQGRRLCEHGADISYADGVSEKIKTSATPAHYTSQQHKVMSALKHQNMQTNERYGDTSHTLDHSCSYGGFTGH
jgi:hypothetical protein